MFRMTGIHRGTAQTGRGRCGPGVHYWVLEQRDEVLGATTLRPAPTGPAPLGPDVPP
jgi:hypothetical protein